MRANPESVNAIRTIKSQGPVSLTNTGRLEFSYLFEVQGEVFWICFKKLKIFVSPVHHQSFSLFPTQPRINRNVRLIRPSTGFFVLGIMCSH